MSPIRCARAVAQVDAWRSLRATRKSPTARWAWRVCAHSGSQIAREESVTQNRAAQHGTLAEARLRNQLGPQRTLSPRPLEMSQAFQRRTLDDAWRLCRVNSVAAPISTKKPHAGPSHSGGTAPPPAGNGRFGFDVRKQALAHDHVTGAFVPQPVEISPFLSGRQPGNPLVGLEAHFNLIGNCTPQNIIAASAKTSNKKPSASRRFAC